MIAVHNVWKSDKKKARFLGFVTVYFNFVTDISLHVLRGTLYGGLLTKN